MQALSQSSKPKDLIFLMRILKLLRGSLHCLQVLMENGYRVLLYNDQLAIIIANRPSPFLRNRKIAFWK
jgi:hypothetical protein